MQIGWLLAADRGCSKMRRSFYALSIDFHPQPDRSLNNGSWHLPIETSLGFVLGQMVVSITASQPLKAITPAGQQAALEEFQWTKVSLLTAAELRKARISFIKDHPELLQDFKAMAKAMKLDGLYIDITDIYRITKQLPRLIVEPRNRSAS